MEERRAYLVRNLKRRREDTLNRGPDHGKTWKEKWIKYKIALRELNNYDEAEKEKASK